MHARQPVVCGRWPDPLVADNLGVTQGVQVRPVLFEPCVYLIRSADGPVARDEDIDVVRRVLNQPQRGEVVPDRVRGFVQVEQRNQDVRKCVAGDESAAFLDQQRRMARGMRPAVSAGRCGPSHAGPTAGLGQWPRSAPCRNGAPRRGWRARAGDPNEDASRSLPQRAVPNRSGRSRGRPFRRRAPPGWMSNTPARPCTTTVLV